MYLSVVSLPFCCRFWQQWRRSEFHFPASFESLAGRVERKSIKRKKGGELSQVGESVKAARVAMLSILVIFFAAIALGASAAEVPVGPPSRAWQRSLQSATSQGWPIPIGREGLLAQDDAKTIYLFSRVSSRPLWIVPFAELLIPGVAFGVDILLNASEFQGPEPLLYVAGAEMCLRHQSTLWRGSMEALRGRRYLRVPPRNCIATISSWQRSRC